MVDRRFWEAELARADEAATQPFAFTILVARRLYSQAPSHKPGVLTAPWLMLKWLHRCWGRSSMTCARATA